MSLYEVTMARFGALAFAPTLTAIAVFQVFRRASDYAIAIWSLKPMDRLDMDALFDQDMLGDDLESWMAESSMLKRTFRNVAVISGLVERNQPGAERTRRQVTVNTDLIYDVLRRHQPDHVLLRATRSGW